MSALMEVKVTNVRQLTPVVREFTFEALAGSLPGFSSGSHVQVQVPLPGRTLRNAYSLLGDPAESQRYRIAVRLQDDSRGGSRYLHEQVAVGDSLTIGVPSNLFPMHSQARHHVLVAGGIGITPFMSYIAALQASGASFELHYAFRRGLTDAYVSELSERLGERFHAYDAAAGQRLDCAALLSGQPLASHVYVCGPQSLLDAIRAQAQALGWSDGRLHWEAFASPEPGLPFTVELVRSGQRLEVPGDHSLLEALEGVGVEVPNLCRGGVCGQCATRYLGGVVEHRDHYLDETQRGEALMPCVSRGGCSSTLLLDL
ncbi:PDR/VanB family oxidoreductase [Stutzerimonas kirkiae]|uniref:Oxidoreductase n=1 Tax=Stutzerimonas kirkiae TaxID=2211392 RepID=A0A4Q9RB56_9GAMM|nr:PDR/VanB family oxidoreductase [Stutzerimonas kirkiae]TBU97838.1 oxidoreductase [Stutzerimonas kirkiae]TBV04810.1 oxidoreductase [Stutzerimonas kirkiae]TBV11948.1 oxidoreductase [Stutzerimonas kirkiae]TBV15044.1 oxidoreductase [Stutzerimonas kirkiae]